MVLLGDEAVALGAVHAGMSAGYAYPGTPSTEIVEYLVRHKEKHGKPHASWCANEKTAYEEALGTSFAGKRSLVAMKHVGLNVAADPFMNSALIEINGGVVVAVADDPGMHSSQDEQDSRYFADFARTLCLEPSTGQEAYDMTREAFELSEKYHIPVMIRLVTRLAHSRSVVKTREQKPENPLRKAPDQSAWTLLPSNARRRWHIVLEQQKHLRDYSENSAFNSLELSQSNHDVGVITTGIAKNYFLENIDEMQNKPSHLHIASYPAPVEKIRALAKHVKKIIVLEEGYPFLERYLTGLIPPTSVAIIGKESGHVPPEGELTPDNIRQVLGLSPKKGVELKGFTLPSRPPQLCKGCPHCDTFDAMKQALSEYPAHERIVSSDIGCYTLGALPPYSAIESCVCMGASVSLAKGAAEAGMHPAVAVIGDSTFLHSGVTPLMDAISANVPMTLIIVDNQTTAMTGGQPTLLKSTNIKELILGLGAHPEHIHVITPLRKNLEANVATMKREFEYKGTSVIISCRECLETAKKARKATKA